MNNWEPISNVLVREIEAQFAGDYKKLVGFARITSLPGMLQRHGLLQTSVFLRGKEADDRKLLELLEKAVSALPGMDHFNLECDSLAAAPLMRRLSYQEAALQAAGWIMLLSKALSETEKPANADSGEQGAES